MKITLSTTIRPVGYDYARELTAMGVLHAFVSAFPRAKSRDLVARLGSRTYFCDTVQVIFLVAQRLFGASGFTRALSHFSKCRLDRATVRHLNGADAAIFYSGAGLRTIRACHDKKVLSVCQVHHAHVIEQEEILLREAEACRLPYTPIYSPAQIRMQVQEYQEADLILCPSGAVKDSFMARGVSGSKLIVVPHGITLPDGFPERSPGRDTGTLRVLYVGQLHYRKGLRYLIEGLSLLGDPSLECRLVGPDFGLSGIKPQDFPFDLKKTGPKKGADLWQEYVDGDIFVLPSLEEGFGLVLLEAMRAGLPVVVSSAVGASDFVRDGQDGFIVPPADPAAIRDKIAWLRDHPDARRRMGESARAKASEVKGWNDSAARLISELNTHLHHA
ncbi:MAG: glycosyltransferase family 4 protein [Verrucomicrobiae bacterium]